MEKVPNPDIQIRTLHSKASRLVESRYTDEYILEELCREGISIDYARAILTFAHSDCASKKEAQVKLTTGLALIMGSVLFIITSYRFVQQTGMGMLLIEWGIVIAGIMRLFKSYGLFKRLGYR
ncbi:hypothetical protein D3H65_03405 [Paraflavitalea soli]|uniref:DUF2157 domain-containing protein n=1 Tax=Paraflavitalea soli TaxID=2315862 RepID=A0A3B7MID9_9BACT|nr:hypothetical protein [Paraflavitalea soli]AXY73073.1 hypothetical protein D3H65_03405 [Paraflavitalea soli]